MAEMTAVVSLDKIIHDSLCEIFQGLYDQHGLMIEVVLVDWQDLSNLENQFYKIKKLSIKSKTERAIR